MLRLLNPLLKRLPLIQNVASTQRNFSSLLQPSIATPSNGFLQSPIITSLNNNIISRNLIRYSITKGKRKSVKAVRGRFYRLAWGAWIRTLAGRHKRLWKKTSARKRRLRQHVLCNKTQSRLLDKMAGHFWTKRRWYADDPYDPYHEREYFEHSARKPKEFIPPDGGTVPNC